MVRPPNWSSYFSTARVRESEKTKNNTRNMTRFDQNAEAEAYIFIPARSNYLISALFLCSRCEKLERELAALSEATKQGETTGERLEEMKKDLNVSKNEYTCLCVCTRAVSLSAGRKKPAGKPLACDCRGYSRPLCLEAQVVAQNVATFGPV